jgi:hypothetical protein
MTVLSILSTSNLNLVNHKILSEPNHAVHHVSQRCVGHTITVLFLTVTANVL